MSLKRAVFLLLLAFAVFFVVHSPEDAARLVKQTGESAGAWFSTAAHSLSKFIKSLT
jgi:hypothetical protein